MDDRNCVVCSEDVDSGGGFRDLDTGGYFLFSFCDDERPIKLWIHHRCLHRVNADGDAGDP